MNAIFRRGGGGGGGGAEGGGGGGGGGLEPEGDIPPLYDTLIPLSFSTFKCLSHISAMKPHTSQALNREH